VQELSAELQHKVDTELTKYSGTPQTPRLFTNDAVELRHLLHGQQVFLEKCAACHGFTGDGAGPVGQFMTPSPRDYRAGIFKFTSTNYGSKPLREDLIRVVRNGARGTSMPSFSLLPDEDVQAVVDYVLVLTHRGELERMLAMQADSEEDIDPEVTPEYIDQIKERWADAENHIVYPISNPVPYSLDSAEKGREAFFTETAGCFKCHGDDGRGRDIPNFVLPGAEEPITVRSADLTAGMFHGGDRPIDIYRRIFAGINGTPMPGFGQSLAEQPETIWNLVHFVQYISSTRRRDVIERMPVLKRTDDGKSADGAEPQAQVSDGVREQETL
jgi:mono/diheme cytochrome c family protein